VYVKLKEPNAEDTSCISIANLLWNICLSVYSSWPAWEVVKQLVHK
jgi:hypothetical protein